MDLATAMGTPVVVESSRKTTDRSLGSSCGTLALAVLKSEKMFVRQPYGLLRRGFCWVLRRALCTTSQHSVRKLLEKGSWRKEIATRSCFPQARTATRRDTSARQSMAMTLWQKLIVYSLTTWIACVNVQLTSILLVTRVRAPTFETRGASGHLMNPHGKSIEPSQFVTWTCSD